MADIHDPIDIGRALEMVTRPPDKPSPYACCPADREPLISTFERRGAEFVCIICGTWYGWLAPVPRAPTPELDARHALLQSWFDAGERGPVEYVCASCDKPIHDDPHTDPAGEDVHPGCCQRCAEGAECT